MTSIGIDLGSRNSCIGIFRSGCISADVVAHDLEGGSRTVPSFIAFTPTGRLFGETARSQANRNPQNTVFDFKRLLGRQFCDVYVGQFSHLWPYRVVRGTQEVPLIEVTYLGEARRFTAIELTAMLLRYLIAGAERYIGPGTVICNAVICVPFCGMLARKAVVDAGLVAGLENVRVVCAPAVAAIPYFLKAPGSDMERSVLVLDLGAATSSAALVVNTSGRCQVCYYCE